MSLGGSGGSGGYGFLVTVTNAGTITTRGLASSAIDAQSIGGGGGRGDMTISSAADGFRSSSATLAFGAVGGEGGDAHAVRVINTARSRPLARGRRASAPSRSAVAAAKAACR